MRMMKTCHFCNSENVQLARIFYGFQERDAVVCMECKCQGPPAESLAQAVINWNETHLRTWATAEAAEQEYNRAVFGGGYYKAHAMIALDDELDPDENDVPF